MFNQIHALGQSSTALGYFMRGVPALFIRTKIAFGEDPDQSEYIRAYREAIASQRPPDFSHPVILRGYESFITVTHELRHFHDALLCLPLFNLFIIQTARLWRVTQLVGEITGLKVHDLPLPLRKKSKARISEWGQSLVDSILATEHAYGQKHRQLYRTHECLGHLRVSLDHVLEANAVTAELLHLIVAHGTDSAELYYRNVIRNLPSIYSDLLHSFIEIAPDFQSAVVALHLSASISLYVSDDPSSMFCNVAAEFAARPSDFFKTFNPSFVSDWFSKNEAKVEAFASAHKLMADDGTIVPQNQQDETWYNQLKSFHVRVYDARRLLITKYIHEFQMNANAYFERTAEMPLPPIVFWPAETTAAGETVAVTEESLRHICGGGDDQYYVIRGGPVASERLVVAGILPYFRRKAFVDLPVVDMLMLSNYLFHALFVPGTEEIYSREIDEMYESALYKNFGVSTRPRVDAAHWS